MVTATRSGTASKPRVTFATLGMPWKSSATEYRPAAFIRSGGWLVVSGDTGLGIWRVSGAHTQPVQLPDSLRDTAALAAGNARIALGYEGGVVRVPDPDPASGFESLTLRLYGGAPHALAISPAADSVAAGYDDGTVRIGRLDSASPSQRLSHVDPIDAHVLRIRSLDGSRVADVVRGEELDTPSMVTVRDAGGETVRKAVADASRVGRVFIPTRIESRSWAMTGGYASGTSSGEGRRRVYSTAASRPRMRTSSE